MYVKMQIACFVSVPTRPSVMIWNAIVNVFGLSNVDNIRRIVYHRIYCTEFSSKIQIYIERSCKLISV